MKIKSAAEYFEERTNITAHKNIQIDTLSVVKLMADYGEYLKNKLMKSVITLTPKP